MDGRIGEGIASLAEGAQQFETLIQEVKARQISETHNAPKLKTAADSFNLCPDELWSRKYMTTAIGPTALKSSVLSQVSIHSRPAGETSPAADLDASRDGHVSKAIKETIIGEALAKPVRRRTWLARQFGRR